MKNLHLVSNDKIWLSKNFFTSNNDLDTIISCLVKDYNIRLINRISKKKLKFKIKNKFDFCDLKNVQEKKINLLMISISPYNFFVLLKLVDNLDALPSCIRLIASTPDLTFSPIKPVDLSSAI